MAIRACGHPDGRWPPPAARVLSKTSDGENEGAVRRPSGGCDARHFYIMGLPKDQIPVLEEFVSVQGEGVNVGVPYYFIRVGGCPLRCNFCDSEYTWKVGQGSIKSIDSVISRAIIICKRHGIEWVSVTGGEPLLYPEQLIKIADTLAAVRIKLHIETSGRFYDPRVHARSDIYSPDAKTPCTGEKMEGYFKGIENMRKQDQVKCLIANEIDLDYANAVNRQLNGACTMVLQPFNTNILTDSTVNMSEQMAGNRPLEKVGPTTLRRDLCIALRWLLETFHRRCAAGEIWEKTIITPQIHVLAYGNEPAH